MTQEFDFELNFTIPEDKWEDIAELAAPVVEEDFDEVALGTGRKGLLAVSLVVPGDDAESVIIESARMVIRRLPEGARLHEVLPDSVSLSEVAYMLGISRQSLQLREMPQPVSGGVYRIEEVEDAIEKAMEPKAGRRKPRFDASKAKGWFLAGRAAREINAKMSLGLLDPATLREVGSIAPLAVDSAACAGSSMGAAPLASKHPHESVPDISLDEPLRPTA